MDFMSRQILCCGVLVLGNAERACLTQVIVRARFSDGTVTERTASADAQRTRTESWYSLKARIDFAGKAPVSILVAAACVLEENRASAAVESGKRAKIEIAALHRIAIFERDRLKLTSAMRVRSGLDQALSRAAHAVYNEPIFNTHNEEGKGSAQRPRSAQSRCCDALDA